MLGTYKRFGMGARKTGLAKHPQFRTCAECVSSFRVGHGPDRGRRRSDWLKGVQLLAVYLVLGLSLFFLQIASPP